MGSDILDDSGLTRFATWPAGAARLALIALALLLLAAAIVPVNKPGNRSPWEGPVAGPVAQKPAAKPGARQEVYDEDIALYEDASDRIAAGQDYYAFIVAEQRARNYPVNPAFTVRMPTLAYIGAAIGRTGELVAALALMLAILVAWWRKLGEEAGPGSDAGRAQRIGVALVFVGASLGLNRSYFALHELWAGGLIALSFGLHRMGDASVRSRWVGAVLAGGFALLIRETALPFVALMLAFALWRREWREAGAWVLVIALFAGLLAWHLSQVSPQILPTDRHSDPWLVMRGLTGWLANVVQSSNLRWLPHWLAGPAVVLMTFGWLGMKGEGGLFGFLLCAGYGVLFMLAGRWNNFYWGALIAPAMFAGLVFAPRAMLGLIAAARVPVLPRIAAAN